MATTGATPPPRPETDEPHIRRFRAEGFRSPTRTPLVNLLILIGLISLIVFAIYQFAFSPAGMVESRVVDLSQFTEQINELSTVRSHLRFGVVVREESGNIIVRRLADQTEEIGMDDLGSILFQDPTLIAELHAVATYGVRLGDIADHITQDDSTVTVDMPKAELLDVKVVNRDTYIVARYEGVFRSSSSELLLEAARKGEEFAEEYATSDTASMQLAESRARDVVALLVSQGGKKALFTELREQ